MPLLRDEGIIRENVVQVVPHVYQITFHAANVLLIVEEELTLIDTGFRSTVPRILEVVRSLNREPEDIRLIVLTHCHLDHAGGARALKRLTGARLACHRADISDFGSPLPYPAPMRRTLELRALANLRSELGITSSEVEIQLEGEEVLAPLGGMRVIHTPGHTPGSICLLAPQHKLLIAGDTLVRQGSAITAARKSMSTDSGQAAKSVQALVREDFDKVCFGHHLPMTVNAKQRLRELVARIRLRDIREIHRLTAQKAKTSSRKIDRIQNKEYHN